MVDDGIVMRKQIDEVRDQCKLGEQKLDQVLAKKAKVFKPEELETAKKSAQNLKENIRIVNELYDE